MGLLVNQLSLFIDERGFGLCPMYMDNIKKSMEAGARGEMKRMSKLTSLVKLMEYWKGKRTVIGDKNDARP